MTISIFHLMLNIKDMQSIYSRVPPKLASLILLSHTLMNTNVMFFLS